MLEQPCPTCGHLLDVNESVCPACGIPRRRLRQRKLSRLWWALPVVLAIGSAVIGLVIGFLLSLFVMERNGLVEGMMWLGALAGFGIGLLILRLLSRRTH